MENAPLYLMSCSNPLHNAHVHGLEITYPYHPQCGAEVVVLRWRKHLGEEWYEVIDVRGATAAFLHGCCYGAGVGHVQHPPAAIATQDACP
jgi:hypothetical protein